MFCHFTPQDTLGGNSRTRILACVDPHLSNHRESIQTLLFAQNGVLVRTAAEQDGGTLIRLMDLIFDEVLDRTQHVPDLSQWKNDEVWGALVSLREMR
jgi:hypothetical protein